MVTALVALVVLSGGLAATPRSVRGQQGGDAATAATAAALSIFAAVPVADCQPNNPAQQACIELRSTLQATQQGIAVFVVSDPMGLGGFIGVLGRDPNGDWQLWFTTQNTVSPRLDLPGELLVCGGGHPAVLLSPTFISVLPDGTSVQGEQFVLTDPGTGAAAGAGWYAVEVNKSLRGWMSADSLTDARNGDCTLHDSLSHRAP